MTFFLPRPFFITLLRIPFCASEEAKQMNNEESLPKVSYQLFTAGEGGVECSPKGKEWSMENPRPKDGGHSLL